MLDLSLIRTGTNNDGTYMYLQDATEWESAAHRGEYRLFLDAFLEKTSGAVEIIDIVKSLTYYSYAVVQNDVQVVHNGVDVINTPYVGYGTDFTIGLTDDGYYVANMVAVSENVPTVEGKYGTSIEGDLVQLVDGELVVKTPSDLVADETFNDWVTLRTLLVARLSIYTNSKYLEYFNESQKYYNDGGHYPELFRLKRDLDYAKSALNSAQYVWELDNYTGAQGIIENMEPLWKQ